MGRARRNKNLGVGQGQDSHIPRIRGIFVGRRPTVHSALAMAALRLPQQKARAHGQNRGLRENPRQARKFGGFFGTPQGAVAGSPARHIARRGHMRHRPQRARKQFRVHGVGVGRPAGHAAKISAQALGKLPRRGQAARRNPLGMRNFRKRFGAFDIFRRHGPRVRARMSNGRLNRLDSARAADIIFAL